MRIQDALKGVLNFFQKKGSNQVSANSTNDEVESSEEGLSTGGKIKVVLALFVVGFATYTAYWVQEPTASLKTDLLNPSSTMQSLTQADTQQGSTQQVSIVDFSFNPATLQIDKGITVLWTNNDKVPHDVVGATFSSGTLAPGQSFSYTFTADGIYDYHSNLNPQMKATIFIGAAAANSQEAPTQQALPDLSNNHGAAPAGQLPPQIPANSTASINDLIAAANQDFGSTEQTQQHGAAEPLSSTANKVVKATKLASSGPEDYVYAGIFGMVLYLNRKKLLKFKNALR